MYQTARTQNMTRNRSGYNPQRVNRIGHDLPDGVSQYPATIYGQSNLFSLCGDNDLMSLSFDGNNRFLDWLGWNLTDVFLTERNFITWVRPEMDGGNATPGYLADPCEAPNGVEWGTCTFRCEDFGRLRRAGPTRDITFSGVRYCESQPRYRVDGSMISNDREYDMRAATEVILQDLKRMVVGGSSLTGGQFDGLERLVKTGYVDPKGRRCSTMDSIVIDWNNNPMSGGSGITWNGNAIANTFNFVDVLLAAFRRIIQRIQMSPMLDSQPMNPGDIILAMPTFMTRCLLDFFTCWSVCPGGQYDEIALQKYEARQFRNDLMGGLFNAGRIYLDGFEIPLMAYDWGLIKGGTSADIYLLTGSVGTIKTIQGELLDMRAVPRDYPDGQYNVTDGGRVLSWLEQERTCVRQVVEMRPRLCTFAPWAQIRFMDVQCVQPGGVLSPDPLDTSFYPETSFFVAGS